MIFRYCSIYAFLCPPGPIALWWSDLWCPRHDILMDDSSHDNIDNNSNSNNEFKNIKTQHVPSNITFQLAKAMQLKNMEKFDGKIHKPKLTANFDKWLNTFTRQIEYIEDTYSITFPDKTVIRIEPAK